MVMNSQWSWVPSSSLIPFTDSKSDEYPIFFRRTYFRPKNSASYLGITLDFLESNYCSGDVIYSRPSQLKNLSLLLFLKKK